MDCTLVCIDYIRVNKMDGIEFVKIREYGIREYGIEYILVNIIDVIDDEKPVQIYGTVMFTDGCGVHIVYDRSCNNPERKVPGEYLSLTGPSVAVTAYDPFVISICLWFHDDGEIVKGEIEGEISWGHRDMGSQGRPHNKLLLEDISGKYNSVSVGYSVITHALSATIDVVMMFNGNGDGDSPAAIYGTIEKAISTFFEITPMMLFDKSANEYVQVSPQQSIPLTRPVFPIPVDSYLTITVDLWDHDSHDQIALGSVEFAPIVNTQKQNIISKYGELQVSLTCAVQF